ncbi:MAG: hypothetical protein SGI74_00140 [Oligoflexia bacterium]|nr:hypothetical protein [Oligoflexia bacterium]
MLYVRSLRIISLVAIAALSTSCLKGSEKETSSLPLPSNTCNTQYDVTLKSRNHFEWPFHNQDHEKNGKFWLWYIKNRLHGFLSPSVYFDNLDKEALSNVQLEHETLVGKAIVFNIEDINYKTINLSMNGLKGLALSHDAIEVKTINIYPFKKHFEVDSGDVSDEHKKDKKDKKDKNEKHIIKHVKLVEITFHLEKFIFGVNKSAAELIRSTAMNNGTLSFKFKHHGGFFKVFDSKLHLEGKFPGYCPSPTPEASPTPTPTPSGTPEPSPSPKPAPVVSIDRISVGTLTNSNNIIIEFSADQPSNFRCSIDSSGFTGCTSPYNASALSDGQHHFTVQAINANGTSSPAQFDWTVDTTAPVLNFTSITPAQADTSETQIGFEFASSEPTAFECNLDNTSWDPCNSPKSYNSLGDGAHLFSVRGNDIAGNISAALSYSWNVKTLPPTVTITQVTPNTNPTNLTSRTFDFTGTADTKRFTCSLDGEAETLCTSPYQVNSLSDDAHQIKIYGYDIASNKSAPAMSSFTVDTMAPAMNITSTVPSQQITNQNVMEINFASNESSIFSCSLDGAISSVCVSPISFTNLSEGAHEFRVMATDTAGNQGLSAAIYRWTTDYTNPLITITSVNPSAAVFNQTEISLNFSLSESGSALCSLDGNFAQDCTSGSTNYLGLSDGNHAIQITALDSAGNASAPMNYAFIVDTTVPVVQITMVNPSELLTNQSAVTISFSSLDTSAQFQCQLDNGSYANCSSPHSYLALSDGNHNFNVRAVDTAGNISANPANYSWTIDTVAPVTQITAVTPTEDSTTSDTITFTLSSNEAGTFECQLDGSGFSPCISPVTYNGLAATSHTFQARARDQAGNLDATGVTRTWDITSNQQPPPVISNRRATNVTQTSAIIRWDTDIQSTTQVSFSTSASGPFTFTNLDNTLVTAHSMTITGLTANTFYYVYVHSKNSSGQESTGSVLNFRTLR